jgi:REP element-mobilizing transposase RayT
MSLFQKSVINKYLKSLNQTEVEKSFLKFKKFYGNPKRIENIRLLKEENYQEGFFREIFVQVLGYTINPDENYNLTTEFKNQTDAKKADGAIVTRGDDPLILKAIGVIELKSTKTTSLESITEQAFNYKNHQPACRYIITSNFEKIRFYIDNATDFEEFNLFKLDENKFKILFLILSKASIFSEIPLKLKTESVLHEENISKQLYQDYSNFKLKIFENLVQNNPQYNKLTLFKKSQKLLDRLIFIFFAEDSGLLPVNSISRIIDRYNILKNEDAYRPLYEIFKQYFNYMNVGRKGKIKSDNIDAYNGGLFIYDTILDNLIIDDEILKDDSLKLSKYDFNTDLDVNILGHIFENSLNEIEELTAELEGKPLDKKKTKRKKEGIFYTPKYITKYIVENTVGELCNQKKKELNLDEIDISIIQNSRTKQGKLNQKAVDLLGRLKTYSDYLLSLKILDPACGSGAFLNQALEFLIEEHQFVDEYRRQLEKDSLGLFDIKKSILENNIFGVDINEESVEIAKLSLWLRTAERGRKLSDLSNNIKCGNSLIDDPDVAVDKAFKWEEEFPQAFKIKEEKAWHITFATHDSRTSQRMIDHKVRLRRHNGTRPYAMPIWLEMEDEIKVTEYISGVIKEDKLKVPAYNICGDHVHLILVCEKEERDGIVGKIKAVSSRKYNIWTGKTIPASTEDAPDTDKDTGTGTEQGATATDTDIVADTGIVATRGHVPLSSLSLSLSSPSKESPAQAHLWTQKYGKNEITDQRQLYNTIEYINNNRKKHGLPFSKDLQSIVQKMTCSIDHAFQTEYKGGFDVVIGNPPYIPIESMLEVDKNYFKEKHKTLERKYDSSVIFILKGLSLLNNKGILSYISSITWQTGENYSKLRKLLIEYYDLRRIINLPFDVFPDAYVDTGIYILGLKKVDNYYEIYEYPKTKKINSINFQRINRINKSNVNSPDFKIILSEDSNLILNKISSIPTIPLGEITESTQGLAGNKFVVFDNEDENLYPYLKNGQAYRYQFIVQDLKYTDMSNYPSLLKYYTNPKRILIRRIINRQDRLMATYCVDKLIVRKDLNPFILIDINFELLYLLALLNSKLFSYIYLNQSTIAKKDDFRQTTLSELRKLPIYLAGKSEQEQLVRMAKQLLELNKKFLNELGNFHKRVNSNFNLSKLSNKLQQFYLYDFHIFLTEVKKQNIKISLDEQEEWEDYFDKYKKQILIQNADIQNIDFKIDQAVYELYGLSEEEIQIVENSFEKSN